MQVSTGPPNLSSPPPAPRRGWGPDPWSPDHWRYWDGEQWTGRTRRSRLISDPVFDAGVGVFAVAAAIIAFFTYCLGTDSGAQGEFGGWEGATIMGAFVGVLLTAPLLIGAFVLMVVTLSRRASRRCRTDAIVRQSSSAPRPPTPEPG